MYMRWTFKWSEFFSFFGGWRIFALHDYLYPHHNTLPVEGVECRRALQSSPMGRSSSRCSAFVMAGFAPAIH